METSYKNAVQENDLKGNDKIAGKFLTFQLKNEDYGLEILRVKEIIGVINITALPQTPAFVKGVINLRGKVVPVIDLRLRFSMEEVEYTEKTCIVVVEINDSDEQINIGIIVDSVSEVVNVSADDIESTPKFGISLNTDFILGMAKTQDKVRTLLDIGKVLVSDEISLLTQAAG